jgi:hypothetical protein
MLFCHCNGFPCHVGSVIAYENLHVVPPFPFFYRYLESPLTAENAENAEKFLISLTSAYSAISAVKKYM